MTFRERFESEQVWYRKVLILDLFHNSMILKYNKWNQRQTAKAMGVSLGLVCEDLLLAKKVKELPELELCKTRKEALLVLRGK